MEKTIPGYEGYTVDEFGNVYSERIKRVLKPVKNTSGYMYVTIKGKGLRIHRIVMMAFVGESKLQVNHKDGNKGNNRLDNLEYVTAGQNLKHSYVSLGRIPPRPMVGRKGNKHPFSCTVIQKDKEGNVIRTYGSILEASRETGIQAQGISLAHRGKLTQSGGYKWELIKRNGKRNAPTLV